MNASYWSFCGMGPYLIAIPYTTDSSKTGPYIWAQQGINNSFVQPANFPGGRVGAIVGQFLMLGDILQQQTQVVGTGDGVKTNFTFGLNNLPMNENGSIYDQAGTLGGTFSNGLVLGASNLNPQNIPGTLYELADSYLNNVYVNSVFSMQISYNPGAFMFASITVNSVTQQTSNANFAYSNGVARWFWTTPFGLQNTIQYTATVGPVWSTTIVASASALELPGGLNTFFGYVQPYAIGTLVTSGLSTINYETGNLTLLTGVPPPVGDSIYALYTQVAPYRVQWSAIGDPTNWPVPLTANAVAFQSGYEDLEVDLGPVKFIAGYPLYGVIFQEFGITRANYVGGNVVFSFAVFSRNRGLVAKGAAVTVGGLVYFLAQDGFFVTDGNSVNPIGTDSENDAGIDNWFWNNVNVQALESIRGAYDSQSRSVYFAIPLGTNILPDTLLAYNTLAQRWTKSSISSELIWTDTNSLALPGGSNLQVGLFDQAHQYNSLSGPTLNGYLESCDIMDTDANLRFTLGVRPHVVSTDTPQAEAGVRNSLQDLIIYTGLQPPDVFSRISPALAEGLYTRVRVSSSAATAFTSATLYQQQGGSV